MRIDFCEFLRKVAAKRKKFFAIVCVTLLSLLTIKITSAVFAYGLSIFFYVYAQRVLGAARTGAYYALAPFIGTVLSLLIFGEIPRINYFIALFLMIIGAFLSSSDAPLFKRKNAKTKQFFRKNQIVYRVCDKKSSSQGEDFLEEI